MFKSRFSNLIISPLHHSNYLWICSRDLFSVRFSGASCFAPNCLNTDPPRPPPKRVNGQTLGEGQTSATGRRGQGPSLCCCKFELPAHRLCPGALLRRGYDRKCQEISLWPFAQDTWSFLVGWLVLGDAELPAGQSFTPPGGLCATASRCLSKSLTIVDVAVPVQGRAG